jgi:uncharacterized protein YjeT (DUF2065 family)
MKALMNMMQEQDDTILRIVGGTLLVLGLLLVFLARRGLGSA